MSHLASLLAKTGARVEGEDVAIDFFTKPLYSRFNINPIGSKLPDGVDIIIFSTSFNKDNRSFKDAIERGIPHFTYPEYISYLSRQKSTLAVTGTHGKTTTCAVATYLLGAICKDFTSLYGSFLRDYSTYYSNKGIFIVEGCEYQDHYQAYDLDALLINSIDFDHPDYFESIEDVRSSFKKRAMSVNPGGTIFFNVSDNEVKSLYEKVKLERTDLTLITFGFNNNPDFLLTKGFCGTSISTLSSFAINPSEKEKHILSDYLGGALVAAYAILKEEGRAITIENLESVVGPLFKLTETFPGVISRSEVVGEKDGIIYIDDYAHHPTEIKVALDSIKGKFPSRRIVLFFMPHTYSRTKALFKEFVEALSSVPILVVQNTYGARSDIGCGEDIALTLEKELEKRSFRHFALSQNMVFYSKDLESALAIAKGILQSGDVLVTMGAGDNRKLIDHLLNDRV